MFTPSTDLKEELASTSIQITCYDRNGEIVKRVTSSDDGVVEDNDNPSPNSPEGEGTNSQGGGDNTGGGGNSGGNDDGDE